MHQPANEFKRSCVQTAIFMYVLEDEKAEEEQIGELKSRSRKSQQRTLPFLVANIDSYFVLWEFEPRRGAEMIISGHEFGFGCGLKFGKKSRPRPPEEIATRANLRGASSQRKSPPKIRQYRDSAA